MMIGGEKGPVVENMKRAVLEGDLNAKVEIGDPVLPPDEERAILDGFVKKRNTPAYGVKNLSARLIWLIAAKLLNVNTRYEGLEKISSIKTGAVVTSNHVNPLDNTAILMALRKCGKKRLHIVSQVTNFAMSGFIGFMMKYSDTIPLGLGAYIMGDFPTIMNDLFKKNQFVLIYPEQEMWFNYRKPRPPRRGAFHYAAKYNVPILPIFLEIISLEKKENVEFHKISYVVHVLDPIYPDEELPIHENSVRMMEKDYEQKRAAYEACYGKTLDYAFDEQWDVAGWIPERQRGSKEG